MTFLIENLDRERFKPFAIVPEPGELSEKLMDIGCPVSFVPTQGLKIKNIVYTWKRIGAIRKIIKEQNIHIIHPDNERDALIFGMAKHGTRARLLWHMRLTRKHKYDYINSFLADAFIGVSEAVVQRVMVSRRHRYRTIFNGVDCDIFKTVDDVSRIKLKLGFPEDKFILIFAGQLKEQKGIFDIALAAGLLNNELKKNIKIYLIGTYINNKFLEKMESLIIENGIGDILEIIPQQKNIHEWMQAADALILPSHEGHEGMGRVLFEAMACGTAVIGSDISGLKEAITDDTGIIISQKSPGSIAQAIEKLTSDNELLNKFKTSGRKRALEFFDIKLHAKKVQELYNDLLIGRL